MILEILQADILFEINFSFLAILKRALHIFQELFMYIHGNL